MDILASFLTFTMFLKLSSSLQCYACEGEHTALACASFDYSERYLKECSISTMCFKRVTTLDFGNGLTSTAIQRGCAQQTDEDEQRKINRKWQHVINVHEAYEEGCAEDPNNSERSTKTLHCYCRNPLCNRAVITTNSIIGLFITAIMALVLSK